MNLKDYIMLLIRKETRIKFLWSEIYPKLREDLANIWDKSIKDELEITFHEAQTIERILLKLHAYYNAKSPLYKKEKRDISRLLKHLRKAKPTEKWVSQIYRDLRNVVEDIDKEKELQRIQLTLAKRRAKIHHLTPIILITRSEESKLIYDTLIERRIIPSLPGPIYIDQYRHDTSYFPILIGGSGREHEMSHILSLALHGHYDKSNLVKVMFDQHEDDTITDVLIAGSHIHHTFKASIFSHIYIIGTGDIMWTKEKGPRYYFWEDYEDVHPGKDVSKWRNLESVGIINGKLVHLSIDLDLLREDYIDNMWGRGGEKFEELLEAVHELANNNTIIAFDVFGIAPFNCKDSKYRYVLRPDGLWEQFIGPNLKPNERRILKPGEKKEIAPSFYRGVQQVSFLIQLLLRS